MSLSARELVRMLERWKLPLSDEKVLQASIGGCFDANGIAAEREVNLGNGDIIDFMVGRVGIEVKIRGQRRAIYRQCVRYCEHAELDGLVLATNAAMGMPEILSGKPVLIANLGKAWI